MKHYVITFYSTLEIKWYPRPGGNDGIQWIISVAKNNYDGLVRPQQQL